MQEPDDIVLLRQYTEHGSEEAFATLVTRHVNKVYSVALRHTRNPHQAEEITQAVFVLLATKSKHLGKGVILSGWLYQTARLTAMTLIRGEARRTRREQKALMQTLSNETEADVWAQIAPLLDTAIAGLQEPDRLAILLRYFDGKSMNEIGATLGTSEDAAKMRVNRAVERLRQSFGKRGIVLPATVLTALICAHSVQAAPVALAKTATTVALAQGVTASGSTLTLIKGVSKVMAWTKMKTTVLVSAVAVLAMGTVTVITFSDHGPWRVTQLRERVDSMRAVLPAVVAFAEAHQDQIPTSMEELKPYLPADLEDMGDAHWEILVSGNLTTLAKQSNLDRTLLLRQKNIPSGKAGIVVYADGSVGYKKLD